MVRMADGNCSLRKALPVPNAVVSGLFCMAVDSDGHIRGPLLEGACFEMALLIH